MAELGWKVGDVVEITSPFVGTTRVEITGMREQYGARAYTARQVVANHVVGVPDGEEAQGAQEGQDSDRFERDVAEEEGCAARVREEEEGLSPEEVSAIARHLKGHRGTSPVAKRAQLEDLVRYVLHLARWQR